MRVACWITKATHTHSEYVIVTAFTLQQEVNDRVCMLRYTGWRTKCLTINCAHNTFLLLQKHLTSGIELILIG